MTTRTTTTPSSAGPTAMVSRELGTAGLMTLRFSVPPSRETHVSKFRPARSLARASSWAMASTRGVGVGEVRMSQARTARPEPPQSRHDRRAVSAVPLARVPITRARRERRTFQPCPRHDGQFAASVPRVPLMPSSVTDLQSRNPSRAAIPPRDICSQSVTLHQRTDTASSGGNRPRDARSRQRPDRDPGFVLATTRGRRSLAQSSHGPVLRAGPAAHRGEPDADRHGMRLVRRARSATSSEASPRSSTSPSSRRSRTG